MYASKFICRTPGCGNVVEVSSYEEIIARKKICSVCVAAALKKTPINKKKKKSRKEIRGKYRSNVVRYSGETTGDRHVS